MLMHAYVKDGLNIYQSPHGFSALYCVIIESHMKVLTK